MNPTFSPKDHVVRGVDYGQPGEVGLYKYKWNTTKLDTVEFIYPDTSGKKFYVSKTRAFGNAGMVINAVPKEYHKIEGYDWFTGRY